MSTLLSIVLFAWLIAVLVQLHFWLVVALPVVRHRNADEASENEAVSVVVCEHQPGARLSALLTDLGNQTHQNYEVIVVNDGPHQAVSEVISEFSGKIPLIREVAFDTTTKTVSGKKGPLAAGIAAAKNPWILLTDADCRVSSDWIKGMLSAQTAKKKIMLGYGPFVAESGFSNLLARFDNIMIAVQYLGLALNGKPYMGVGRNLMYRKTLFENVGFDSHRDIASGDDDLFIQEASTERNTGVCLDPETFAWSAAPGSLTAFLDQKRRHASTANRYSKRSKRQLVAYGGSFVLFWILMLPVFLWGGEGLQYIAGGAIACAWITFGFVANRLRHESLIWLFPVYCLIYACYLCVMGVLTQMKPRNTWNS